MIKYTTKRFDDLSRKTIMNLKKMSYGPGHGITEDIYDYLYLQSEGSPQTANWTAIIVQNEATSTNIGWALIRKNYQTSEKAYSMFYIKNAFRNKGVGAELFDRVEKYIKKQGCKTLIVYPHAANETFFNRCQKKYKNLKFEYWSPWKNLRSIEQGIKVNG